MKKILIPAVIAASVLGLGACGAGFADKMQEPFKDAPIGNRVDKPVTLIDMPDGYANVATVCVNGVRYSTTTVGSASSEARALSVVIDPSCDGK